MKVYWSSLEYKYSTNTSLQGGFVYAFVKAFDVREALAKILTTLNEKHMDPIEIEYVMPYDTDTEWETADETSKYVKLSKPASKCDKVVFDDFYAYEDLE